MNNHFVIICTGYNCEQYIRACVKSVLAQKYRNWKLILIEDGSTDRTFAEMCDFRMKKIELRGSIKINVGASKRRFEAIKEFSQSETDIILLLGMDDELKPNALERINQEYESGKWMTYGSWENQHGKKLTDDRTFTLEFNNVTHLRRDYRKETFRSTAPNTFRRFLFDKMTEDDFKVNGEWIKATTESPLMFACLEMCGKDRIGVIHDSIYIYNQHENGHSTKSRMGRLYQNTIYQNIISRPKFPLLIR